MGVGQGDPDREAVEASGEWLYQQDGMLFGPMPARVLLEKLERGEVAAETPVAAEDGVFRPLRETPAFVVPVARLEARRKVDGEAAALRRHDRRRRLRKALLVTAALAGVGGGVAAGVAAIARSRSAGPETTEVRISAPLIALAEASSAGEPELYEYVEDVPAPAPGARPRRTAPRTGQAAAPPAPDADGLATHAAYDEAAIQGVLRANQAQLVPCVKQQAAADPTFRGEVPFSFTVENDGKVGKVWVDKPGFATGTFHDCIAARLAAWRFPAFEGERPSISLSFRVGK